MRPSRAHCKEFPSGCLVEITQGRNAGATCFVVGIDEKSENNVKILIADGRKISARNPKRKSPRHVKHLGLASAEVARRLSEGKFLDDGWLCELLRRLAR